MDIIASSENLYFLYSYTHNDAYMNRIHTYTKTLSKWKFRSKYVLKVN